MSDEHLDETDQGLPPHMRETLSQMNQEHRIGRFPGAGPKGAPKVSYEELPDDREALKHMYLELQRTYSDTEAKHHNEKERLRFGGEDTLEDLLSHFWHRGVELAGVIAALAFAISLVAPEQLSQTQQMVGIIALTAFWERYLRSVVVNLT